jgi:pyridoxal phosphate enzyme (YggS family)
MNFNWVHSLDRIKIAQRLNDQRPENSPPMQVCLQVNTSDESTKSGCSLKELKSLADAVHAYPNLQLRGLMTIPARVDDFERQRIPFRVLKRALDELNQSGFQLDTLSMGMSNDMEAAIAEGATIVRIGTALFGPRQY